jgi:hypothetical protein
MDGGGLIQEFLIGVPMQGKDWRKHFENQKYKIKKKYLKRVPSTNPNLEKKEDKPSDG